MPDDPVLMLNALTALRAAYRSGATSVAYDGKTVTYRSVANLVARKFARTEHHAKARCGERIRVGLIGPRVQLYKSNSLS